MRTARARRRQPGGIRRHRRAEPPIDVAAAEAIVSTFIEAVLAPAIEDSARAVLARKPNMRVVIADFEALRRADLEFRSALGAMLVQERDVVSEARRPWSSAAAEAVRVVTKRPPSAEELEALRFAWRISAHVRSNAVIFTDARRTLAIGAGQMSRVDAVNVAIMKARAAGTGQSRSLAGSVAASDAFFPFRDGLDAWRQRRHCRRATSGSGGTRGDCGSRRAWPGDDSRADGISGTDQGSGGAVPLPQAPRARVRPFSIRHAPPQIGSPLGPERGRIASEVGR